MGRNWLKKENKRIDVNKADQTNTISRSGKMRLQHLTHNRKPATVTQTACVRLWNCVTQVCCCTPKQIFRVKIPTGNRSTCLKSIHMKKVNWIQTTLKHKSTIDKRFSLHFPLFFLLAFLLFIWRCFPSGTLTKQNISHESKSFNAIIIIWKMFNFWFVFIFAFERIIRLLEIPFFFREK